VGLEVATLNEFATSEATRWVRAEGRAIRCNNTPVRNKNAGLAHLVERLFCNQKVAGSSPATGTTFKGP
jgi:hypothetical protein